MFEDQPLEGLHQMRGECYWPIAAEVLWLCGLQHWYYTGGHPQLWYFPQIQAHVEHVNMYHTVGLHSTLIFFCSFPTCVERDRMVVGEVGYVMEYSKAEELGDG